MDLRNPALWKCAVVVLVFALFLHNFLRWWWTPPGIVSAPLSEYDFIIVGAGTAGCAVARRVWEGSTYSSILLIEAGGTAPFISSIPLVAPLLQGYSSDWAYKTVPQEDSQYGMKNRISAWPRGKVLGGSSVLNFMIHMWGTRADFDENWSSMGTEYTFKSVQEYYKRMENYQGSYVSGLRGTDGPMAVQELNNTSPLASAFINGATDMGIKTGDLNGELEDGVMLSQSNILRGSRVSTFEAYLRPILKGSNIQLLINTMVTKVVFHDKTAIGVDVLDLANRKTYHVRAKKEIILSAGSIGTPHILMLSGVGPKEHLREHRIPLVADLPGVGRNLHDHLNVPMYFHLDSPVSITAKKAKSLSEVFRYMFKKEGFLAHSGVEVITRLPVPDEKSSISKIYFMLFRLGTVDETVFTEIANYKKDVFEQTFPDSKNQSKEGFLIMTSCTHPHSRGLMLLKSSSPEIYPHIDPRYLSYKKDSRCLINAMRMAAKLGTTFPLRKLGSRLHLPAYKACSKYNQSIYDDEYLECWMKTSAITGYHPLGTCSIGPHDDANAVLDNKLRVRGVRNLRVVDGSAFPYPIGGNPHASILMLAEKGAEYILRNMQKTY